MLIKTVMWMRLVALATAVLPWGGRAEPIPPGEYQYDFPCGEGFTGEFDCLTGMAHGTVCGKACVDGYGCDSGCGAVATVEPPFGMDGSWSLTLNVSPDQLITGTITLSNDETLQLVGKAKYQSKIDATSISAKGDPASPAGKGTKIKMTIDGSDLSVDSLSGKALGQKVQ